MPRTPLSARAYMNRPLLKPEEIADQTPLTAMIDNFEFRTRNDNTRTCLSLTIDGKGRIELLRLNTANTQTIANLYGDILWDWLGEMIVIDIGKDHNGLKFIVKPPF